MIATEVAVVGAGPAGASAALTLARQGRQVVLVDRARFPRDKCCGDGLTIGALRRLDSMGLRPGDVASWQRVDGAVLRVPDGRQATFPLPAGGTFAATARRYDLDAALVAMAEGAGARVLQGCQVTGATAGTGIHLQTDAGPVDAAYVVAADGMWSSMRKAFGVADEAGYRGDWHALRQYFTGLGPAGAHMWVWFEADLLPGYAWSFPLPGGGANVGFGVHRRAGAPMGPMAPRWADILRRPHIASVLGPDAAPEGPARTWPIPARIGRSPMAAAGGRVLFVGDAARATDSLTGEGIAQALETGDLAARAIVAAGPGSPEAAGASYTRTVSRTLATDDRLSRVLSAMLRRPSSPWMTLAAANDWTRRNFARWMFEDYPRALLATPRRWHHGAWRGPAPYATPRN
ncbi:MAG: NAD(P)/FAD-dependent oxidoreductase [Acidimicrobiales bacterium]